MKIGVAPVDPVYKVTDIPVGIVFHRPCNSTVRYLRLDEYVVSFHISSDGQMDHIGCLPLTKFSSDRAFRIIGRLEWEF